MQLLRKSHLYNQTNAQKPRILISTSNVDNAALATITGDTSISYSDKATTVAIIKAGGLPLYIPSSALLTVTDIQTYIALADGVILPGADTNVNPVTYGESLSNRHNEKTDNERDQVDIKLAQLAYNHSVPLLGICRGMQIINVALGGTLYQDVMRQHPQPSKHNISGQRTQPTHEADIASDSILQKIFNKPTIELNGGHQQAVRQLSDKLRTSVVAKDGIVEAYEGRREAFLLGIQFHAELLTTSRPHNSIFEAFIKAAKNRKDKTIPIQKYS